MADVITVLGIGGLATLCLLGVDRIMATEQAGHLWGGGARMATASINATGSRAELTLLRALLSGVIMFAVAAVAYILELDLTTQILVAYVRCAAQLTLLGVVLFPILTADSPYVTLAVLLAMLGVAASEVSARLTHDIPHLFRIVFTALGVGVGINVALCVVFLEIDVWWSPLYVIPIWGMTLGNSLSAVTLGLGILVKRLGGEGVKDVEMLLSHGATRMEAIKPLVKEALTTGLVPTISSMNVIGLVFLPGMVTGQLLGGASPDQAVYYQMLIMFVIAGACCFSTLLAVACTVLTLTTATGSVNTHLIVEKPKGADMLTRLYYALKDFADRNGGVAATVVVVLVIGVV